MDWIEALGFTAGVFGTFASAPQAIKIVRTRSARDVSLAMFLMSLTGSLLWASYGWLKHAPSIVFWNCVAVCMFIAIIALKLRHGVN